MTPLALAFRSRWPDVTLDIREGNGADLEEWLLHRHVDLAILQDPPALPDIEITPMLTESLGLVAPVHSHLVADTRPMSLRELGGDSLILPGPQHWIRRRLEIAAQQSGMRLNMVLQVNSIALAKVMVRSGLGCTIFRAALCRTRLRAVLWPSGRSVSRNLPARARSRFTAQRRTRWCRHSPTWRATRWPRWPRTACGRTHR